ncbi:MAG: hypothetical protein LBQ52_02490 [Helicobacteraceae bacterium]|jgi:hypothetical protein|nr:hypothetical protein [Helicobacteraceae bacterium]
MKAGDFDGELYKKEMIDMIDRAIVRLKNEEPNFKIFTASIWTDAEAAASSIGFDDKENSLKCVENHNKFIKKYYDKYMASGEEDMARSFKPIEEVRMRNPADYTLRDYEEITHKSFVDISKRWNQLKPALTEVGKYAFEQIKYLNIDEGFELSINGKNDWYDKVWKT